MKKKTFVLFLAGALCLAAPSCREDRPPAAEYDVAAFVWPAYHNDPRFAEIGIFPDGVGEWEAVYKARPKFEGHRQPRIPLWGYLDEADPQVQEKKIRTALEYGVNTFIFDWYWYDDRPFLEDVLNKGFLQAGNNRKMKFYLMWANHVMTSYLDAADPDKSKVYWPEPVTPEIFDRIADHLIEDYSQTAELLQDRRQTGFPSTKLRLSSVKWAARSRRLPRLTGSGRNVSKPDCREYTSSRSLWFLLPATSTGMAGGYLRLPAEHGAPFRIREPDQLPMVPPGAGGPGLSGVGRYGLRLL
ncbi:MAG: glycoside hydrolase family 99-like domain-containing protein [Alistipes shahii]|uniref:glycoside hydrolase family 99-like domain-containing protein n=1 Tax=Alistipes shahii TaxID=328814 RepID=UPI00399C7C5D